MRKTSAKLRLDGEQTRASLIEAAGELAAELGWPNVQAKQVCERAGVNAASVNYWFGGRDALYEAVLAQIPDVLLDEASFQAMLEEKDAEKSLDLCLDFLVNNMVRSSHWAVRVWAREVTSYPSEAFLKLAKDRGVARVGVMRNVVGAYLGLPIDDDRVCVATIHLMSMMFWMMTVSVPIKGMLLGELIEKPAEMAKLVKNQWLVSLQALRDEIKLAT